MVVEASGDRAFAIFVMPPPGQGDERNGAVEQVVNQAIEMVHLPSRHVLFRDPGLS